MKMNRKFIERFLPGTLHTILCLLEDNINNSIMFVVDYCLESRRPEDRIGAKLLSEKIVKRMC